MEDVSSTPSARVSACKIFTDAAGYGKANAELPKEKPLHEMTLDELYALVQSDPASGDLEMIDITPDGERGVIQDELADLNTSELKN
jgi:hypothetical protein